MKYEDLDLRPQECLQEIAIFFNFPYDDCMLNFHVNVAENNVKRINENIENIQPKAIDKYEKLSRPVNTERLSVWEQKLTKEEIEICSSICRSSDYFNYKTDIYNASYNWFDICKGYYKAKIEIIKNKLIYRIPLSIKLKLI